MSMASIEALEARRKLSVNLFDPTFGKGGAVALGNGPAAAVSSDAVQLQADGKIVVNTPSGVRRFNGDGWMGALGWAG